MFNISTLTIYSITEEEFTYNLEPGINYFKGVNSSGKTEFYNFIDYMFGSSENLINKPWYADVFNKAIMDFEINSIKYRLIRTRDPQVNFFSYASETHDEHNYINLVEYKERLNTVFSNGDYTYLKNIKEFTNENLTFRTFTMFNFLGEKRQGLTYNFFDKCSDVKYYTKLMPILNYLFNNNLEKINELQLELSKLQKQINQLETDSIKYNFIIEQINLNLKKLDTTKNFNGKNTEEIFEFINEYKKLNYIDKKNKGKNIVELEVMFNMVDEQIKVYENRIIDTRQIQKENRNRKELLGKLDNLLERNENFMYLIEPLEKLINDIDSSISFSKYLINDNTIQELKAQRELLKNDIKDNDNRFKIFTIEEKVKAITLIEEYLSANIKSSGPELVEKKKSIKEIKSELKALQNADDPKKIKDLSKYITILYTSAEGISNVVKEDSKQNGFKISYSKKGNVMQPVKTVLNKKAEEEVVNYYVGSMARHTLIQLSGYLAFLKMMLSEGRYPLIPLLVIDHISKPFDNENSKAIGKIISKAYEDIGKSNLQVFIFDDKEHEDLGLKVDYSENLVTTNKTGFVPFYKPEQL
ncbi:hypothetical protein [Planococcus sp. 4-30]|uniref:hypothetical protein n=1 Tax=Planococcus sp. 4-30 TaxID=2874583 RepID=UPI001CBBAEB6|nr:hypothetical protein [Planococcus sp. 4-30]